MIRVGLLGHSFVTWGGGIDLLRIVASSLQLSGAPLELHLLVPMRGPRLQTVNAIRAGYRAAKSLIGRRTAAQPSASKEHIAELVSSAGGAISLHEVDIGTRAIERAASRLSLDVLVPAFTPLPEGFPVPWVGYVYDFQHRHFPELFSAAERMQRDRHFSTMLEAAPAVIVNARAVAADIARFHPSARARVFALPFAAAPQPQWLNASASPALRYGIKRPYFIICNQFWKHKDHATAFNAFGRIAGRHPEVDMVCTGMTGDYRDPSYFPSLQQAIAQAGLTDRIHILGMIPKADQIALVKHAIALVQPTLFEGGPGGGAVYDAVALGVPSLVSDIPVSRELNEPGVTFFPAGNAEALAELLAVVAQQSRTRQTDAEVLLQLGRERRRACGVEILAAIEYARSRPWRASLLQRDSG